MLVLGAVPVPQSVPRLQLGCSIEVLVVFGGQATQWVRCICVRRQSPNVMGMAIVCKCEFPGRHTIAKNESAFTSSSMHRPYPV